jgi:hypothetical protein
MSHEMDEHPQINTYETYDIIQNGVSRISIQNNMKCYETVMDTQRERSIDSRAERGSCLFCLRGRQDTWS